MTTSPTVITSLGIYSWGYSYRGVYTAGAPNWTTANLATFIPLMLPFSITVAQGYHPNVAGNSGKHFDIGVYSAAGARLASTGSTVADGTNHIQAANLTSAVTLTPGRYYLAMATDSATFSVSGFAMLGSNDQKQVWRMSGSLEQTSAFPLPATMSATAPSVYLGTYFGLASSGKAPL